MKKKLLLIILLLVPFLVSAKEEITYEWEKTNGDGFLFLGEKDNKYMIYEDYNFNFKLTYYKPNGRKVNTVSLDPFDRETIDIWNRIRGRQELFQTFYITVDGDLIELDPEHGRLTKIDDDNDTSETVGYLELSEQDQKKYTGEFHIMYELYENRNSNTNYQMYYKDNCLIVYKYVNSSNGQKKYLEIYDKNEDKIFSKKIDDNKWMAADVNEYGIYVVESSYDYSDYAVTYTAIKYDLNGKELYRQDLTDEILDNATLDEEELYYSYPSHVDIVKNGLVVSFNDVCLISVSEAPKSFSNYCNNHDVLFQSEGTANLQSGQSIKSTTSEPKKDSTRSSSEPAFNGPSRKPSEMIKFYIDYSIDTKIEGQGVVVAVDRSVSGEGVTFTVEPRDGYVLSVIKVTDANGNVIEFTNNTFTMPSSDVMIEAVFVPIGQTNPNTKDIAIIATIIVGIGVGILAIKYYKKAKWMN